MWRGASPAFIKTKGYDMSDETKHAIVWQPVDSVTSKYELFDTKEEADDVMSSINAAFNAKHAMGGLPTGVQLDDDVVTSAPTRVHLTKIDLAQKREEAKKKKEDAEQAAADDLAQRKAIADEAEKNSKVLDGINNDQDNADSADAEEDAENAPLTDNGSNDVQVGTQM
jgi:hypothetical protein